MALEGRELSSQLWYKTLSDIGQVILISLDFFICVKAAFKTFCLIILIEVCFYGYFTSFLSSLSISSFNASFLLFCTLLICYARVHAIPTSSVHALLQRSVGGSDLGQLLPNGDWDEQPLGHSGHAKPSQAKGFSELSHVLMTLLWLYRSSSLFSLPCRMENSAGGSSICYPLL